MPILIKANKQKLVNVMYVQQKGRLHEKIDQNTFQLLEK